VACSQLTRVNGAASLLRQRRDGLWAASLAGKDGDAEPRRGVPEPDRLAKGAGEGGGGGRAV